MKDSTRKRIVKIFWLLLVTPFAALALLILLVWATADIPTFEELENPDSKLATQVIAREQDFRLL